MSTLGLINVNTVSALGLILGFLIRLYYCPHSCMTQQNTHNYSYILCFANTIDSLKDKSMLYRRSIYIFFINVGAVNPHFTKYEKHISLIVTFDGEIQSHHYSVDDTPPYFFSKMSLKHCLRSIMFLMFINVIHVLLHYPNQNTNPSFLEGILSLGNQTEFFIVSHPQHTCFQFQNE